MKLVIDRDIPSLAERIRSAHPEVELLVKPGRDIAAPDVADADALIVRTRTRCDAALLAGSRVRMVGTATIGTDHIDTEWCRRAGIRVVSAPGCNAPGVMQYVVCSLAAAGFDPAVHTLGVVGKGNVGRLVVDVYRDAGANVLVCDPPRADAGYDDEDYLSLAGLMERCDAVTFHVPLTVSGAHPTRHLLSPGMFPSAGEGRGGKSATFPKILVNASRGSVFYPDVFRVSGDVRLVVDTWPFEEESMSEAEVAAMIEAAFIATPHIAGYTFDGKERATRSMINALNAEFGLHIPSDGLADYNFHLPSDGMSDYVFHLPPLHDILSTFDPLPITATLKSSLPSPSSVPASSPSSVPAFFESLRTLRSFLRP